MRITNSMLYQRSLRDINANRLALADTQRQISTGKRVATGSDDPLALAQTQAIRREMSEIGGYLANVDTGRALLQETDQVLSVFQDAMLQLQDRLIQASGGGKTADTLNTYKAEILELKENLRQLANSRDGQGRYLFAGWKTAEEPYPTDLTMGSNGLQQIRFEVGRGTTMEMSVNGDSFIGETVPPPLGPPPIGEEHLFAAIDAFVATLGRNPGSTFVKVLDPTAVPPLTVTKTWREEQADQAGSLQRRIATLTTVRTSVAERIQRLDELEVTYEARLQSMSGRIDDLEAADLPTASLNLARQDAAFKAALSVTGRTLPTSLVDYLR
ncbi:MAG: flagellar hook-associated protein FlgL [Candidatus Sericytochromatia bacterium]|nr:flagellar hook-associated protein FlgL [Candidatus Sericytochromatia bacterium]